MESITNSITLDQVIQMEPSFNFLQELAGYHISVHITLLLVTLGLIVSILAHRKKYKNKEYEPGSRADKIDTVHVGIGIPLIFALFTYFALPALVGIVSGTERLGTEWKHWNENIAEPYIENLPVDETTNIHHTSFNQSSSNRNKPITADVTFSVNGQMVKETKVDVHVEGDAYIVKYKHLEKNIGPHKAGNYDVLLLVPEDFTID